MVAGNLNDLCKSGPLNILVEQVVGENKFESISAAVDTFLGTRTSDLPLARLRARAWNEALGNVAPLVGTPHGMTHITVETQRSSYKCISPFYRDDEAVTGIRLSHWLSGSCTQDYGSATIIPVLLKEGESSGEFRKRLRQWATRTGCNHAQYTRRCKLPSQCETSDIGTWCFRAKHIIHRPSRHTLTLFTGEAKSPKEFLSVDFTASSRSGIIRLQLLNHTISSQQKFALVFVANTQRHRKNDDSDGAALITHTRGHDREHQIFNISVSVPVRQVYGQRADKPVGLSGYHEFSIKEAIVESHGVERNMMLSWAIVEPVQEIVTVLSGSSFTGIRGAKDHIVLGNAKNFSSEFRVMEERSETEWNSLLERIKIRAFINGVEESQFYSAMYHSMLVPRAFSDSNGDYLSFSDGYERRKHENTHTEGYDFYTDFSAWDTFRSLHPLLTLISPEKSVDMVRSIIYMGLQNDEGLPKFPAWNTGTTAMIGDHCTVILADAIHKGLLNHSQSLARKGVDLVLQARMLTHGNRSLTQPGLLEYIRNGYISSDTKVKQHVSTTLEYSFNDAIAAGLAASHGFKADAFILKRRSGNFLNLFNKDIALFQPRDRGGRFQRVKQGIDPQSYKYKWLTEGTPLQWTLGASQHDFKLLVKRLGGDVRTEKLLDDFFGLTIDTSASCVRVQFEDTKSKYWHGNEPNHHVPFLYVLLGRAWKTQAVVRHILSTEYSSGYGGISGNEDAGQMSSWLIWASLGLYPLVPGAQTPWYVLGSPAILSARLKIPLRSTDPSRQYLLIEAINNGPANIYVQDVLLDGTKVERGWLYHDELMSSDTLTFVMGVVPNPTWPRRNIDPPVAAKVV